MIYNEWDDSTLPSCSAACKLPRRVAPGSIKRWRLELKFPLWLSLVSCKNPPGLTACALHLGDHKSLLGLWLKKHFTVRAGFYVFPVHTSLFCRQDDVFSHSNEKQNSGVWKRAWLSLGASQVWVGLISGRDWQCFWRQYPPFEALSGIWLFYL